MRAARKPNCLALAFFLTAAVTPGAQDAGQPSSAQQLTPGAPVERQLAGGESHLYQLSFGAEECVTIAIEQRGVDVTLALVDQSGTPLREENRLGSQGTEWLLWTSPGPGLYQLAVRAKDARAPAGVYHARVAFSRADDSRKQAFEKYAEAWRLMRQGRETYAQALRTFEEVLTYWKTTGDRDLMAITLHQIGVLNEKLGNAPAAFDNYQQALTLFREIGRTTETALVLNDYGVAYLNQGAYAKASEQFAAALPLTATLPPADAAELTLNSGNALLGLSKHQDALEFFRRALTAFRALGNRPRELEALSDIGRTHYAAAEPIQSLEYASQGLELSRAYKIPLSEARFAQDVCHVFQYLEDYEKARDYCERSLRLFRAEKYVSGEIGTLLILGDTQYDLSDNRAAQESYETAARLASAIKFPEAEARAVVRLGAVLSARGEFASALEHRQRALTFYRATGNRRSEVQALHSIGVAQHQMGNLQEARVTLQMGLQISREAARGFGETALLGELVLVTRDNGNLDEAEETLTALLGKFDAGRRSLLAPGLSATFGNGAQSWYGVYADLLMRLHDVRPGAGYDTRAWQAAEHAKAWGLLEMLAEARTDLRQSVDPVLLEKQRRLWEQLSSRAASSQRSGESSPSADEAAKSIVDLTVQLQLSETQLRAASPRYVDLVQPQPLTSAALQQQLLDEDTVLLEFSLGDEQSWLWAVTRNTFDSYRIAPRARIEDDARRLYELLTARQPKPGDPQAGRGARVAKADAALPAATADMGRLLLGPVEGRLRQEWKGKRLVIVASGALEYLPFGALRLPAGPALLAEHEVLNLPSASVLAALRDERARTPQAKRTLALFADPVFDNQDPRVARAGRVRTALGQSNAPVRKANEADAATSASDTALRRAESSFTRTGFGRLPFSREEAAAIAALVPRDSLLEATDFQANHARAVSGDLSQYRFVHFATHGLLNSHHPELSGLVLSLVDETGQAQNGFLRLQEIFDLKLPADVVVLSACQTALGKEIRGEGLVGLTRGFMYAGAQRVVASLWEVDDLATAELMKAFYRGMLKDGLRPAEALRRAQLDLMKQPRWASPFYWAGFVMQGNWR